MNQHSNRTNQMGVVNSEFVRDSKDIVFIFEIWVLIEMGGIQ
jgi:hypothetical protein